MWITGPSTRREALGLLVTWRTALVKFIDLCAESALSILVYMSSHGVNKEIPSGTVS